MVIAFDLDDTLYKERDFACSAYREAVESIGLREPEKETAYEAMRMALERGDNPFDALQRVAGRTLPIAELVAAYRRHRPSIRLDGETAGTLGRLRDAGHRLCLVTDGRSQTQRNKMEALGLAAFFDNRDVIISEETGADKHSPDNFRRIEEAYPAQRYVYVGDNPAKDFEQPERLGWATICLKDDGRNIHPQTGGRPAQYAVDALSELPELIEKIERKK